VSQDPTTAPPRPTWWRTAAVVGVAVVAALGGGVAIAANSSTPRQVVSPPAAPADFVGITPVRVLDTRDAAGGPIGVPAGKLGPDSSIDVAIGGEFTIPAEATAVAVNVTIDEDATLKSFLTVYPTGVPRPNASTNNAEPGLVMSNSAIFQLGTDGKLTVFNQQGSVNVIMDVTGYFLPESGPGTTTTTAPGGTTTTAVPITPTFTIDAASYPANGVIQFTGTNWTGCGDSVNILVDDDLRKVLPIKADGTFDGVLALLGIYLPADNPHTLTASTDFTPQCTVDVSFDTTP
jgi:hypothetical protein